MRKITLSLPEDIEEELRRVAYEKYRGLKGSLSLITADALRDFFIKLKKEEQMKSL